MSTIPDATPEPASTPVEAVNKFSSDALFVFDSPAKEDSLLGSALVSASVFRMRNTIDSQLYAVKTFYLRPIQKLSSFVIQDVVRKVEALQGLEHPRLCRYFGCYFSDKKDQLSVVMGLHTGGNLSQYMSASSKRHPASIMSILKEAVEGLQYLHQQNICHGNLKAENILIQNNIAARLSSSHALLVDYGLTPILDNAKLYNRSFGSQLYFSYEQALSRKYEPSDDIWSLGCIMVELLLHSRLYELGGAFYGIDEESIKLKQSLLKRCQLASNTLLYPCIEAMLQDKLHRPSSSELLAMIEAVEKAEQERVAAEREEARLRQLEIDRLWIQRKVATVRKLGVWPMASPSSFLEMPIGKWLENRKVILPVKSLTKFFRDRGINQVSDIGSYCSKRNLMNWRLIESELSEAYPTQPNIITKVHQMIDGVMVHCDPSLMIHSVDGDVVGGQETSTTKAPATSTSAKVTIPKGDAIMDRRGLGAAADEYSLKDAVAGGSKVDVRRFASKHDMTPDRRDAERRLALKAEEDELEYQRMEAYHRRKQREDREALQARIAQQEEEERIERGRRRLKQENDMIIAKREAAGLKFEHEDALRIEIGREIMVAQAEREKQERDVEAYRRQLKAASAIARTDGLREKNPTAAAGAFETARAKFEKVKAPEPDRYIIVPSSAEDRLAVSKPAILSSVPLTFPKPPPPPPALLSAATAESGFGRRPKNVPCPPDTEVETLQQWLEKNNLLDLIDKLQSIRIDDVATLVSTPKEVLEGCGMKKVPLKKLLTAIGNHNGTPTAALLKLVDAASVFPVAASAIIEPAPAGSTVEELRKQEKERLLAKERSYQAKREQDLKTGGSWECGMCKTVNQTADDKCMTCFSSKPRPAMDLAGYLSSGEGVHLGRSKSARRGGGMRSRSVEPVLEASASPYLSSYAPSYVPMAGKAPSLHRASYDKGTVCPVCKTINFGLSRCYNCNLRLPPGL